DDRPPPVRICGRHRLLDLGEEAVEPWGAYHLDALGRDPVQLDRLSLLDLVPDQKTVGGLVEHGLAREVVPAPDQQDRRDPESAAVLDCTRPGAAERAPGDEHTASTPSSATASSRSVGGGAKLSARRRASSIRPKTWCGSARPS